MAFYYFTQVATANEGGKHFAYYWLGVLSYDGRGTEKNDKMALHYFEKSVENGSRWIHGWHNLGLMYYNGEGAERDVQKAAEYWEVGASKGSASSANNLAWLYYDGEGSQFKKDETLALKYFNLAASLRRKEGRGKK